MNIVTKCKLIEKRFVYVMIPLKKAAKPFFEVINILLFTIILRHTINIEIKLFKGVVLCAYHIFTLGIRTIKNPSSFDY